MSELLNKFQQIHRQSTRQIGPLYCIPAAISNATRLFGYEDFTQERIRDEWYEEQKRTLEKDVNQQMSGAGFGIVNTLKGCTNFAQKFETASFCRPGDQDPFNLSKADEAISFVESHMSQNHAVIVSTWTLILFNGALVPQCCHMWLTLAFERAHNYAIIHDPGDDQLQPVAISHDVHLPGIGGGCVTLNTGLRGRVTHTDYSCLAIWKK